MIESTTLCARLHRLLTHYPEYRYPIDWKRVPSNGVYFFYEGREMWGHGGRKRRIVRIGTHREGNFVSRMRSHYIDDRKIEGISRQTSCPKDRSIFRKNIGRALLARAGSRYLSTWNIDFQIRENRDRFGRLRRTELEKRVEHEITRILRKDFSFRVIPTGKHEAIIGGNGLEARLIGTIAHCQLCKPSKSWLGRYSPVDEIKKGKLWLVQHLNNGAMTEGDWVLCAKVGSRGRS
jgi:hypothetical protein